MNLKVEEIYNIYITSIPPSSKKCLIEYFMKKHKLIHHDAQSMIENMDLNYPYWPGLNKPSSIILKNELINIGLDVKSMRV